MCGPPGAILQECFTGVPPYGDGACSDDEVIKAAIDREATVSVCPVGLLVRILAFRK